ncbi:hypothetical protein D3C76_707580 [compost metagenome]
MLQYNSFYKVCGPNEVSYISSTRLVVNFMGCAVLVDGAFVKYNDIVGHGERL